MSETYQVVPYERRHRDDLLSTLFYSRYTHTHLDWYKAGEWLGMDSNLTMLAQQDDDLIAFISVSHPLNGASWMRLACVAQGFNPETVMPPLWDVIRTRLISLGTQTVSVLALNPWLSHLLPYLGFRYLEDVVTLYRAPGADLPQVDHDLNLRSGYLDDIPAILRVDHAAFDPPWQMSADDIRQAQRQAASCTLAELGERVIGYEISTRHHTSGHLARIAVHPDMQGKHVGAALLAHVLARLVKRGVRSMTVNTQQTNIISQRLYQRFGFHRNGFDLAVWHQSLVPQTVTQG